MRVAIIGGAGYVGGFVCRELVNHGHEVVVIAGGNAAFLVGGADIAVISPSAVSTLGKCDAVVNLAYPSRGPTFEYPQQNRSLRDLVGAAASVSGGRVVHASTLAVFGFALDVSQRVELVSPRRDFPYVEAKIEMENLLSLSKEIASLDIVRFGNVWGPASPTWTAAIADKLLFGDPVRVDGASGASNITDVNNIASYLRYLLESQAARGVRVHHLAEFAATPWDWWIDGLASALEVVPAATDWTGGDGQGMRGEILSSLRRHGPLSIAREWMRERKLGSVYRSVIRAIPSRFHRGLRQAGRLPAFVSPERSEDAAFLSVITCSTVFRHSVAAGWTPPISRDLSLALAIEWMREAGY